MQKFDSCSFMKRRLWKLKIIQKSCGGITQTMQPNERIQWLLRIQYYSLISLVQDLKCVLHFILYIYIYSCLFIFIHILIILSFYYFILQQQIQKLTQMQMQMSSPNINQNLASFGASSTSGNNFISQNRQGAVPNAYLNQPIINRQLNVSPNMQINPTLINYSANRSVSPFQRQIPNIPIGAQTTLPINMTSGRPMGGIGSFGPMGQMNQIGRVSPIVSPMIPIGQVNPQISNQKITGISQPFPMSYPPQPTYLGYKILKQPPVQIPQNQQFDTHIEEPKVYCVICERQYESKDRKEHAQRHRRRQDGFQIKNLITQISTNQNNPQLRPIVQPEEYNIQYNPNQFILEQVVNFSTPIIKEEVHLPPARLDIGLGTSDVSPIVPTINQNNQNIQHNQINEQLFGGGRQTIPQNAPTVPIVPIGSNPSSFQQQSVRLTTDGETVTYNDPNAYQANRVQRQSQINPPQPINTVNDSRFSNNSVIVQQPSPAVLPYSLIHSNRQTIQQQQPYMSRNSDFSYLGQNQGTPILTNTGLPPRTTVYSQDSRESQVSSNINPTNLNANTSAISQKIEQNYQSVMSPIGEQSFRLTNSLTAEQPRLSQQQFAQPNTDRLTNNQVSSQQGVLTTNRVSQQPRQDTSILDDFNYGSTSPDVYIQPRQSKGSNNFNYATPREPSQIRLSDIIGEKR